MKFNKSIFSGPISKLFKTKMAKPVNKNPGPTPADIQPEIPGPVNCHNPPPLAEGCVHGGHDGVRPQVPSVTPLVPPQAGDQKDQAAHQQQQQQTRQEAIDQQFDLRVQYIEALIAKKTLKMQPNNET